MSFGFAGAGAAASNTLQDLLLQAFRQKQAEQQMAMQQQAGDRSQQQLMLQAEQERRLAQQAQANQDRQATQDRSAENDRGMKLMLGDYLTQKGQPLEGLAAQAGVDLRRILPDQSHGSSGPYTLGPGGSRFDENNQLVASVPFAAKEPKDERLVQVVGPNGAPMWVRESQAVGKPAAQAARAVTGIERQSLAFYNRAKDAVDTLTTGAAGAPSLEQRMAQQGLLGQGQLQYAPNLAQTGDQQAYRQAQRAFTEARLRKESGAAIPNSEYENDARTYFVQPGDTPETVEQKKNARQTVLEGLKFASGRAYDEFYGDQSKPEPNPQQLTPPSSNVVPQVQKWGRDAQGRPARIK